MTFASATKPARILHTLVVILSLFGSSFSIDVAAEEPTLKKALEAPAWALAQGYLWVKKMLHFLPAVDSGTTIHLPDETITKSNVEEYRGRYEKRLALYGEAIKQRGYKTISGAYKGETTESCARIQSAWVGVIHERGQSGIEIAQDGIEAQVVI